MEFLEYGAIGLLALVIFLSYRNAVKQARDDRKFMEDRSTQVIKDYNEASYAQSNAIKNLTAIQSELITWLKARNGHTLKE